MKYSIEIYKIVEGGLKGDAKKVKGYTELLIDKLNGDNEEKEAKRFKGLIESVYKSNASLEAMNINNSLKVPVDFESRIPMADIINPEEIEKKIVLSKKNREDLETFILNYKSADKLNSLGIGISNTLLMYGPPGCGKTKSANYIAQSLKLPLVIARLDSMVSSYLGTTAKNIRNLFEYAERVPCVLFLDEFDAIAKARDDNNELGELKRVVNSLLQNIDKLSKNSLLIAATNHEDLLDKAIWRRFEYKLKIGLPDYKAIQLLIDLFFGDFYKVSIKEKEYLSYVLYGLSGATIEELVKKAMRKSIIFNYKFQIKELYEEIFDYMEITNELSNDKENMKRKAKYLREIDEKVFSYSVIASILGISKTQASNLLK